MPHLVIEYSANLKDSIDIDKVMAITYQAAVDSGLMKPQDIKVRALAYADFMMADGGKNFVHTTTHLLTGRTDTQRCKLSNRVKAYQTQYLKEVHSISIDIVEMNSNAYIKRLL